VSDDAQHDQQPFAARQDGLFLLDVAGPNDLRMVVVSSGFERLMNVRAAACIGRRIDEIAVGPVASRIFGACLRCVAEGREIDCELDAEQGRPTLRATLVPLFDDGRVARIVGVIRDTSEFKRLETELDARAQEFRTLADNAPDLISRYDTEGRLMFVNRAVERFGGVPLERIRGKSSVEIAPEAPSAALFQSAVMEVVRTGLPVSIDISFDTFTAGRAVWHDVRFVPELDRDGRIASVLGIGRDLTQTKATEALLREREQQFRTLAENTPDTIARFDRDGRYLYVNKAIEELQGRPAESYVGTRVGEVTRQEGWIAESESAGVFHAAISRTFEQGVRQDLEVEVASRSGPRIHAFRIVPERNADGEIVSALSISRDITEIRAAEAALKQMNAMLEARVAARTEELQDANRELEKFAYTVSHDLRAPLRAIDGFVHLIEENERSLLSEEGRRMLGRISSACTRLGRLIDDILEYSRVGQCTLALRPLNMTALAREVVASVKQQYPRSVVSVAQMPDARGDPTMLLQVLENLIGNALKFSARSSEARVEIGARSEGDKIIYYVADNCIGFDTRYADKLFGVFERLHAQLDYPGTGVGLAIVKRLIERQGGRVWAESRPGAGSTFYFTLA
jgi:PAS domain S-box-containing protein